MVEKLTKERIMKREQGFTLIELIVVIAIIGILAAVAVPAFIQVVDNAHEANMDAVEGTMRSAVTMWASNELLEGRNFAYPAASLVTIGIMVEGGIISDDWTSATAGTWVYGPGTVGTLVYTQTGSGAGFEILKTY